MSTWLDVATPILYAVGAGGAGWFSARRGGQKTISEVKAAASDGAAAGAVDGLNGFKALVTKTAATVERVQSDLTQYIVQTRDNMEKISKNATAASERTARIETTLEGQNKVLDKMQDEFTSVRASSATNAEKILRVSDHEKRNAAQIATNVIALAEHQAKLAIRAKTKKPAARKRA